MVHEAWDGDKAFPKALEMGQREAGRPEGRAGDPGLDLCGRRRGCTASQFTVAVPPVTRYAVRVQFRPQPSRTALYFTFAVTVAPLPEMSVALNRVVSG